MINLARNEIRHNPDLKQAIHIEKTDPAESRFNAQMIALSADGIAWIEWREVATAMGVNPFEIDAQSYASDEVTTIIATAG